MIMHKIKQIKDYSHSVNQMLEVQGISKESFYDMWVYATDINKQMKWHIIVYWLDNTNKKRRYIIKNQQTCWRIIGEIDGVQWGG